MGELAIQWVDDKAWPLIRLVGDAIPFENATTAARTARAMARMGQAVLLTLPEGRRLYRHEWAAAPRGSYPYRVECPRCERYRRWPRGAAVCDECETPTPTKSAAVAESNVRRGRGRRRPASDAPPSPTE